VEIKQQANSFIWHEPRLGLFQIQIVTANAEGAENCRRWLPLIEKFMLQGLKLKQKPSQDFTLEVEKELEEEKSEESQKVSKANIKTQTKDNMVNEHG